MTHLGEIAGVATSVSWALCSLGFALASRRVGALAVNQIRIMIAVAVLVCAHGVTTGALFPLEASSRQLIVLAVSGVVGLALGDSCYFHAIGVLGPRLGTVLMATAPLMCALLAWPVLGESLGLWAIAGIALTLGGVFLVVTDPRGEPNWHRRETVAGKGLAVAAGLLGALGQASGLVLSKLGMEQQAGETAMNSLSATLIRMVAGAVAVVLLALGTRGIAPALRALRDRRAMAATMFGVLFGPTLGVWLSMVAVRHADAGVAATLMALPPVLMIPIAWFAYRARSGVRAIAGTLVALAGTAVMFLRD